jgi:hypothetical protein
LRVGDFYQEFLNLFPVHKQNQGYNNFFWYLCFGTGFDKDSKRLLFYRNDLSNLVLGKRSDNWVVRNFLEAFSREVLGEGNLVWSEGWREEHCRQMLKLNWGDFEQVLQTEKQKLFNYKHSVYLSGEKFFPEKSKQDRRAERRRAEAIRPQCEEAALFQRYLHELPPHRFSKNLKKYFYAANEFAAQEY